MEIRLYPTTELADAAWIRGSTVAVIDVLRASSTILAGIESGAREIVPVGDIETASRLVRSCGRGGRLLAGERGGIRVAGFELGNSPLEFTPGAVGGRTVVLTTTNGTPAFELASEADRVLICCINNVGAVAEVAGRAGRLAVLCCGTEGGLAAEDILCGGMLIEGLRGTFEEGSLGDAAGLALVLADKYGGETERFLRTCEHGRRLIALGFEGDVAHCARRDISTLVPELKKGSVTG